MTYLWPLYEARPSSTPSPSRSPPSAKGGDPPSARSISYNSRQSIQSYFADCPFQFIDPRCLERPPKYTTESVSCFCLDKEGTTHSSVPPDDISAGDIALECGSPSNLGEVTISTLSSNQSSSNSTTNRVNSPTSQSPHNQGEHNICSFCGKGFEARWRLK